MPRKARIDTPGALHHIIIRGIEKSKIFRNKEDYDWFLERLGIILLETLTPCYAWVLMPNHAHFLLRTGNVGIATIMKRLLTGYAQHFNRRHKRVGHLFQNRYKSVLCEEDQYFLELVRYIHLNPTRAELVKSLNSLNSYQYSGHAAIIGTAKNDWQDKDYVLSYFSKTNGKARRKYISFITDGIQQGYKPELSGGGLLRSYGGWKELTKQLQQGISVKGDERILGSSDFVLRVLEKANERLEQSASMKSRGINLEEIVKKVAKHYGIETEDLTSGTRKRHIAEARSVVCYVAVNKLKQSCEEVAKFLTISPSAVCKAISRGKAIIQETKLERIIYK